MTLKLYRSARIEATGVDTIEAVRMLSATEEASYLQALSDLQDFEETRDLMMLVADNLEAVRKAISELQLSAAASRTGAFAQDTSSRRILQRLVVSYLTSARLYLDHRQTHLTRRYGARSNALKAFNDVRRSIHAREPTYRFVYELRNFVQHCGMPLQVMRSKQRLVRDGETERIEAEAFVGCDRDELLMRFQDWNHSRAFLESLDPQFEVLPLLERNTALFWEIEGSVVAALMPLLWTRARDATRILAECTDAEHIGIVAVLTPSQNDGNYEIIFRMPPLAVLSWLRLLTLTPGPPGFRIEHGNLALATPPRLV